jgi:hypothetical protein
MILLVPLCARVSAQEPSVIHQFLGTWQGEGTLFGADARFSMKWEWVLEQKFVRLTFQNEISNPDDASRILKAQAFYKQLEAGELEGTWFDSRGMVLPLRARAEQATLTTHWGTEATEQGRTVYRLRNENQVEVEDSVLKDGQWHLFGQATYRRVDGP